MPSPVSYHPLVPHPRWPLKTLVQHPRRARTGSLPQTNSSRLPFQPGPTGFGTKYEPEQDTRRGRGEWVGRSGQGQEGDESEGVGRGERAEFQGDVYPGVVVSKVSEAARMGCSGL